jgi:hypothetical protein
MQQCTTDFQSQQCCCVSILHAFCWQMWCICTPILRMMWQLLTKIITFLVSCLHHMIMIKHTIFCTLSLLHTATFHPLHQSCWENWQYMTFLKIIHHRCNWNNYKHNISRCVQTGNIVFLTICKNSDATHSTPAHYHHKLFRSSKTLLLIIVTMHWQDFMLVFYSIWSTSSLWYISGDPTHPVV